MKLSLYGKFIVTYILLAMASFIFVATAGSYIIEKNLIYRESRDIHSEAVNISDTDMMSYFSKYSSKDTLYKSLSLLATYQNASISILNTSGEYIIDTDKTIDEALEESIENFDPASFGPGYYEISNFYGKFSTDMLNVMVPITFNMATRGYVAIHMPLTTIYAQRQEMVNKFYIITAIILAISFIVLLQFHFSVYKPLKKITEGAQQFSIGNLDYRIKVKSNDEMGYLADSMNLMAREIDKSNEYQSKFISNISHDFRSPLTSIKGFTDAMLDGTIPPEAYGKYLQIISDEADRLTGLTQNITKLNSLDSDQVILNRTNFDMNKMIRHTATLFEGSCRKKHLSLNLVLCGDVMTVDGDEERIKQVLYNLLDNAIKFSSKNSTIKIETSEKYGKCYVSVKDKGCGIKKEDLPRIWNRFYKSDSSRGKDQKGTGLGLAIVKEIMKAHGQNINVISTEGVGTEFTFTLPLVEQ